MVLPARCDGGGPNTNTGGRREADIGEAIVPCVLDREKPKAGEGEGPGANGDASMLGVVIGEAKGVVPAEVVGRMLSARSCSITISSTTSATLGRASTVALSVNPCAT